MPDRIIKCKCSWEGHRHHMSGAQMSQEGQTFVVHWLTREGNTVHGNYYANFTAASEAYYERCRLGCLPL